MNRSTSIILLFIPLAALAHLENENTMGPGPIPGFPRAGEGIKVMPLSQMNLPEQIKKQVQFRLKQQKTKGYYETDSTYPKHLLRLGGKNQLQVDETGVNPHDTRLKKHLSQIQLLFSFNGIPFIKSEDVIGFAAMGKWQDGWTGIVEIFNDKKVGTCSFSLQNMSLDGGPSAHIAEEAIRYDINQKPTTLFVEKSIKGGFLYQIIWSDKNNNYHLDCANEQFDTKIVKQTIKLAQSIDHTLNQN